VDLVTPRKAPRGLKGSSSRDEQGVQGGGAPAGAPPHHESWTRATSCRQSTALRAAPALPVPLNTDSGQDLKVEAGWTQLHQASALTPGPILGVTALWHLLLLRSGGTSGATSRHP
jgi:hypothetical protein